MNPSTNKRFFFVIPPGFENVALYEWSRILNHNSIEIPSYDIFPGGFECELPMAVGLSLNYCLRIPVRILMRLEAFDVTEKKEFVEKIKSITWKEFAPLGDVQVSSRSSKLRFKDEIVKIFKKSISAEFSKKGTSVYIRFFRDECTISIDTSGDPLYQRGFNKRVEEAPIRDNYACGLLQFAMQGEELLSDWEVVDPFAGSGTFLLEAGLLAHHLKREFSFNHWPNCNVEQLKLPYETFSHLVAADKSEKAIKTLEHNFSAAQLKNYDVKKQDLLAAQQIAKTKSKRLVITNPPYGKRLAIKNKNFFNQIYEKIIEVYQPERLGIIIPKGQRITREDYELVRFLTFENMGLPVQFRLYMKK